MARRGLRIANGIGFDLNIVGRKGWSKANSGTKAAALMGSMAMVLGESGRYVSDQVVVKFRSMMKTVMVMVAVVSALSGLSIGLAIRGATLSLWSGVALNVVIVIAIYLIWKRTSQKLNSLERQRENMRRGATGESAVALILANLPEDYHVINDLTTPFGNLDHVVIGPTGVFVLDTKNWRGLAAADGKGELLLNGRPTDKPFIRRFVGRIMGMKEKVRVLAPGLDPFFQPVFVFTSARVEATWGSTGSVHCLCDDQLVDYIVDTKFRRELKLNDIERIKQAFRSLALMDKDFPAQPFQVHPKVELQTA